jgi:hypothetical protein
MGRLQREAERLRRAIERAERSAERAGCLAEFPGQCCDHGVRLLALHLSGRGYSGFQRARGVRGAICHVWLKWRGINLDITADQFIGECQPSVVVTRHSPWHDKWKPTVEQIREYIMKTWQEPDFPFSQVYGEILVAAQTEGRA